MTVGSSSIQARATQARVSRGLRDVVFVVGIATSALGVWAFFLPQRFFDDFPIDGADWVSTLGVFNDHLMRDYGAAQVGLGFAAILVALTRIPSGIAAVMAGYVAFGMLHLGYHFTTFGFYPPASAAAQAVALATFLAAPLAVIRAISIQISKEKS